MSETAAPPRITGLGYVRPLGKGGYAQVHLYEQDMPRRQVAVKVLNGGLEGARDRSTFSAEADAMARLSNHPSIVSVYQAGIATDGRPYIAMEYCPDSMRDLTRGRPAHLQTVLDAGVRLAGALETAHRAGVLHRDIKPSNVLVATTGRPALSDFGIASLHGRDTNEEAARAMSLPWAAPEVLTGDTTGTIASEVWSLGATLYTFAAGHSPFEAADPQRNTHGKMSSRIKRAHYSPIAGARGYEPFDALMARSMSLRPQDRFASMAEFAEALQQLQRHFGLDVTPFDVVDAERIAATGPVAAGEPAGRGPTLTAVRSQSRAEARAEAARRLGADRDGVVPDRAVSPLRAGLIGAGIAVAAIAALAGLAAAAGLFG